MFFRHVCLIGSSNAINLQSGDPTDPIMKQITFVNNSIGGAEVNINSPKSILNQLPKYDQDLHLIICVGSNGVENHKYNILILQYHRMILKILRKGFKANQIDVLLPMVRGKEMGYHWKQLFFVDILENRLKKYGIGTHNIYDSLPLEYTQINELFGVKDLRQKKYIHYSKAIRQYTHEIIAYIIKTRCRLGILNIDEYPQENYETTYSN